MPRFRVFCWFVWEKVPNAVTLAPGADPEDIVRKLEVNIQLPDGPPPVQQGPPPGQFQVRMFVLSLTHLCVVASHDKHRM